MADMTDRELIGYCEIHCETPRALFSASHINRMLALAGHPEGWPHDVDEGPGIFHTVHEPMKELCSLARTRLSQTVKIVDQTTKKGSTMRVLDEHKVNPGNDRLVVTVEDEPGSGGACHRYAITGFDTTSNVSNSGPSEAKDIFYGQLILFQNGPITEDGNGINGLTHEVLLAIVADRLRGFQKGPYSCKANACALTHIEEALHWLQQRTLERMRRGVEGTHTV